MNITPNMVLSWDVDIAEQHIRRALDAAARIGSISRLVDADARDSSSYYSGAVGNFFRDSIGEWTRICTLNQILYSGGAELFLGRIELIRASIRSLEEIRDRAHGNDIPLVISDEGYVKLAEPLRFYHYGALYQYMTLSLMMKLNSELEKVMAPILEDARWAEEMRRSAVGWTYRTSR
ncbi:hypothetical protein JK358_38340 [Nocardia sp. 2]|uniref:Uncharacterized protein n=1 Tax=Nocardia acididurans TaxID=2802282 RepID=A0ABS1MI93_9NOCA|nr:hypothetical protein [Nocardia acididurans]MBL1080272.1 hypothetical protein [Nocardia acididurans]